MPSDPSARGAHLMADSDTLGKARAEGGFVARDELLTITATLLYSARHLLDAPPAEESLERFCGDLTRQVPNIALAWTWFGRRDTDRIRPQVMAGAARDYATRLDIRRSFLTTIGPAFRALAGERPAPFAIAPDSLFSPWRDAAREHGIRSVMALPIESSVDDQRGILVLYSRVPGYFDAVGTEVFGSMAGLFGAVLSRNARMQALQRAAMRDRLTGLLNRNAEVLLAESLKRTTAASPPSSVLIIDIDRFKTINDAHGHDAGDTVLAGIGRLIAGCLRASDLALRWGGEEFVVGLPGVARDVALGVAEAVRERLARATIDAGQGRTLTVTCSIGLATLHPGEDLTDVLRRADMALYAAKKAGRDQVAAAD